MKLPQTAPRIVVTATLSIALGASLAGWLIALMFPDQPVAPLEPAARRGDALVEVAARFSGVSESAAPLPPDVRLVGIVSAGPNSRAIIMNAGKSATLAPGEEVRAGLTLATIGPDFIELRQGATTQRIELSPRSASKGPKP